MADPRQYRPEQGAIPTQPGVYRFLDGEGRVLYVGKAKNLRARLSSYFQDPAGLSDRIRAMVYTAEAVKWVVVGSEVEALTLEYLWIKEFTPTFNVVFRDNKSYPYLAVSLGEEYPRVWVTRQEHRKGTRYLGPYTKVWAIRETLDQLLSVFPMRSCTKSQFNQARRLGRPCLFGHIGKCSAPCIERVTPEEHRETAMNLIRFMEGGGSKAIATRRKRMLEAANAEEYETAARLRDEISALEAVNERNVVVLNENLDVDIFGIAFDEIEASVQVFYVRGGRIRGQQAWISDEIGGIELSEIVSNLVLQVYGDVKFDEVVAVPEASRSVDDRAHTPLGAIPSEIWVPGLPEDAPELQKWLAERRGGTVRLKTPRRGDKAKLAHTVRLNAEQALARHKLARAGDITVRSQALEELRDALELDRAPLRIECYDVSHTQGTHQVASMVVFEDGLAKKADYRHFIVRGPDGEGAADDTAAMDEVLRRRLARLLAGAAGDDVGADERGDADAHGPRFARPPVPGLRGDGVERGQGGVDPGQDGRAEDGGAGAARIALEQPGSEDLLQAADGVGQRRLGDVVLPGGRAEGAGAGDRLGVAQALGAESIVHTRSLRTDSSKASPPFASLGRLLPARRPRTARRGAGVARWPAPAGPTSPSAPRLRTRAASAPGAPACR